MVKQKHLACEPTRELLVEFLAGDQNEYGLTRIIRHLRQCEECSDLVELHEELLSEDLELRTVATEPSEDEFAAMREAVFAEMLGEETDAQVAPMGDHFLGKQTSTGSTAGLRGWNSAGRYRLAASVALAAAVATVMLAVGFLAGRNGAFTAGSGPAVQDTVARAPVAEDGRNGAAPLLLEPVEFSAGSDLRGYDLENVRVRALDDQRVSLSFDLATHVEVERSKDDPLVTEAVVRSILGGSDLGGRLHAIQQTEHRSMPSRVRDALVQAMLGDPDVAVRMQAQQRLSEADLDPAIERACLQVLEMEDSVQMRLMAIDMLSGSGVAADRLRRAVESGRPEPGNALKMQAANYVGDF